MTVETLRDPRTVRERAHSLLQRARDGESGWFTVDDEGIATAAVETAAVTRKRYPDLAIPYHSRWRHFTAGGLDRTRELTADPAAMVDLAVVSVLLDAGAGAAWTYTETGQTYTRSEGLAVASWHGFRDGRFSSDPANPLRVDAAGLQALRTTDLAEIFQVSSDNPLVGLEGRLAVLHRLGTALTADVFGGRPSGLLHALGRGASARDLLRVVLDSMSGIWPSDNRIDGVPVGDCWRHPAVGWMPFHKLSQWLTYSLLEPFEQAGVAVTGLDELTGLPEYRNGGLLLDTGALRLRDPAVAERDWAVGDELVIEWRALTVALLDEIAEQVRTILGTDMPLACVLEGGTWAAGRALAARLRGGLPPLRITSDGTVF